MRSLVFLGLALLFFVSCEEQPVFIPDGGIDPEDTTSSVQKVVLLEELTGVSCPNCPAGTAALESILTVFEGKVVSTAIHGKFLAQPTSQNVYDFRNEDAEDLENFLAPFLGKPAAVIDRTEFEGQDFMTVDNIGLWQSLVSDRLAISPQVSIDMTTEYNDSNRQVSLTVDVTALEDLEGNIRLTVLVNESHIIDAQSDQNDIISEYEHNHVLREVLTGVSGDIISIVGMTEGEVLSRSYSYTIPDQNGGEWIPGNMELVSFVTASQLNNEVLQAASSYIE